MRAKKLKRPRYSASPSDNWAIKVCDPDQANCGAPPLTICSSSNGQNHGTSGKTGAKAIAVQTKNNVTRRVPRRSHQAADMDRQKDLFDVGDALLRRRMRIDCKMRPPDEALVCADSTELVRARKRKPLGNR